MATKDKVVYARKWRKERRENRRLEIFAMQYLQCKYSNIHTEIQQKFEEINVKYPNKNNLTKTAEFVVWKSDLTVRQHPVPDVNATTPPPQGPVSRLQPSVNNTAVADQEPPPPQESTTTSTRQHPVLDVNATTPAPQEPVSRLQPSVNNTAVADQEPPPPQESTTTSTTVVNTSQELAHLYSFDEDPWMLDLDSSEMARIIEDLNNDPELQGIMDTFST